MAKLPKSIIKKYGITKKAWQVFKGTRSTARRSRRKSSSKVIYTMARRRTKRSGKRSGKGSNMKTVLKILGGAALAAGYEVFISPMIPLSRNIKNMIELVIGAALLLMPRMPTLVRSFGGALVTINAFDLLVPLISGTKSAVTGGSSVDAFLQN